MEFLLQLRQEEDIIFVGDFNAKGNFNVEGDRANPRCKAVESF
jgi:hypothetical protein